MDDALKARLIGAAVLVALAVLLIPELLSDRKAAAPAATSDATARGTRTVTIELAGNPQGSTLTETLPAPDPAQTAAAPSASEPPAGSTPASTQPEATPPVQVDQAVAPAPTQASPPSATAPQPVPPSNPTAARPARGGWAVQVGAFGSAASAEKLVRQLQEAGYQVFVSPVARGGRTLHRVRVGPEIERTEAESLVAGLKVRGLPATVVAND